MRIKTRLLKYFLNTKYLIKYKTLDFFDYIIIEINTSCNRRCVYCPNSIYDRGLIKNEKLMEKEVFYKIIKELKEINFSGKIFPQSFGEPLLDKRLIPFIKYIKQELPKSKVYFITNGDYLTEEIRKELINLKMVKIIVSPHDDITFKDRDFNNRGGLVELDNTCYEPRCLLPDNPLTINYNGDVILCCNDYLGAVKFGNLKENKLIEIWNSKKYKRLRKELKNKEYNLTICKKCVGEIK